MQNPDCPECHGPTQMPDSLFGLPVVVTGHYEPKKSTIIIGKPFVQDITEAQANPRSPNEPA